MAMEVSRRFLVPTILSHTGKRERLTVLDARKRTARAASACRQVTVRPIRAFLRMRVSSGPWARIVFSAARPAGLEPRLLPEAMAAGKDFGRGAYHWLTGTAAGMMRAMVDYIIGVHPELDGLRIQPAVDPTWKRFSIRRRFRGAIYEIEFENPGGRQAGVKEIRLDGRAVRGTLLPLPTAQSHHVKVVMG
ncbi:MAG: hypothetical protein WBD18_12360 [Phycisphaerae bacterium]